MKYYIEHYTLDVLCTFSYCEHSLQFCTSNFLETHKNPQFKDIISYVSFKQRFLNYVI